jgi:hypothetical protein
MPKVYVACKFRPEDSKAFTYEWEGEPLKSGDIVKVPDARSNGWKRVTVVSIADEAPPFPCKPILGLYNPDLEPETAAKPAVDPLDLSDDEITF